MSTNPKTIQGKEVKVVVVEQKSGYADVRIETPRMNVTMWIKTEDEARIPYDMVLVQSKKDVSTLEDDHYGKRRKISPIHGVASVAARVFQKAR